MLILLLAVASICLSVAAQFTLKAGMSSDVVQAALAKPFTWQTVLLVITRTEVLGGLLLYFLSAAVWLGVLSRWDVSKAYPLVGAGFLLVALVGFVSGENLGVSRLLGISLIAIGVTIVARS